MQIGVILHCYMEVPRLFQDADVYTAVKTLSGEVDPEDETLCLSWFHTCSAQARWSHSSCKSKVSQVESSTPSMFPFSPCWERQAEFIMQQVHVLVQLAWSPLQIQTCRYCSEMSICWTHQCQVQVLYIITLHAICALVRHSVKNL